MEKIARRHRTYPLVIAGLLLCVAGVFWPREEVPRLFTLAINIWPGVEGLLLSPGVEQERDPHVNYVEMSWSSAAMGLFHRRVVDAIVVTPDELLRLGDEGARPRALAVLGVSHGSDAVLARPEIKTMEQLRGRRIGVEQRSAAEYLLVHALAAHDMVLSDVMVVPLNIAETEEAYDDRDVDAVVAADPWRVRLQDKGAVTLYDSRDMGLEMCRLLVTEERSMQTYANELRGIIADHFHYVSKLRDLEPANGLGAVLRREGLDVGQWHRVLEAIQFPVAEEQSRLLGSGKDGLEECLERIQRNMLQARLLKHSMDVRALLIPEFSGGRAQ